MFEEESDAMVGIPSTERSADSSKMRKRSKLGGVPIWHGAPPLSSRPQCKRCSKEMIFVGQVYSPTTLDRSLYLFCCPTSCSSHSDGWYVIRNQGVIVEETPSSPDIATDTTQLKTNWGDLCNGSSGTNWNDDDAAGDDDDEDLSDLMDLLNARDDSLNKKASCCAPPPIPLQNDDHYEQGPFELTFGPIWLNEEYESTFLHTESDQLLHEEELLRKYLDDMTADKSGDEDPSILTFLRSQQIRSSEVNDEDDSDSDEEELRTVLSTRAQAFKMKSDSQPMNSNQLQRNRKIELLFQRKLATCPQQVLRYAYGGVPLWCSDQDTLPSSKCPGCGEIRVFEMQLMPTTLAYLSQIPVLNQKSATAEITEESGGHLKSPNDLSSNEIDFGVVTIWSCPNSCEQSFEELVIVQPPNDAN